MNDSSIFNKIYFRLLESMKSSGEDVPVMKKYPHNEISYYVEYLDDSYTRQIVHPFPSIFDDLIRNDIWPDIGHEFTGRSFNSGKYDKSELEYYVKNGINYKGDFVVSDGERLRNLVVNSLLKYDDDKTFWTDRWKNITRDDFDKYING